MKSGISANQLWTQQPVASRLVEVNTKTGFSLTAGSYIVRASCTQQVVGIAINGVVEANVTISSVTTTRASVIWQGQHTSVDFNDRSLCRVTLTSATNVKGSKNTGSGNAGPNAVVLELF